MRVKIIFLGDLQILFNDVDARLGSNSKNHTSFMQKTINIMAGTAALNKVNWLDQIWPIWEQIPSGQVADCLDTCGRWFFSWTASFGGHISTCLSIAQWNRACPTGSGLMDTAYRSAAALPKPLLRWCPYNLALFDLFRPTLEAI